MDELREEHSGEEGLLAEVTDDKGKISKGYLDKRIKEIKRDAATPRLLKEKGLGEEANMLQQYKKLMDDETEVQFKIKTAKIELEKKVIAQYQN